MVQTRPTGKCVHCLRESIELTWDHLFPKSWYPATTADDLEKWQIPACEACNKAYGKIEEELLTKFGLCLDPEDPASAGIVDKVMRSMDAQAGRDSKDSSRRAQKCQRILNGMMSGAKIPDHGVYPGFENTYGLPKEDLGAVAIPAAHLKKLNEKFVRGVFWLKNDTFIEPPYSIGFFPLPPDAAEELRVVLQRYGTVYSREPGLRITHVVTPEDGMSSFFEIVIWKRLRMYASVDDDHESGAPARRSIGERD